MTEHESIVVRNIYKLQSLVLKPDVLLSVGRYSQVFLCHAAECFPDAAIIPEENQTDLDILCERHVKPHQRLAIMLDRKGNEKWMLSHPPSVAILQRAEFVTAKLAPFGSTVSRMQDIFTGTHRWDSEPPMFYAWRKPDDEPMAGRGEFGAFLAERGLLGNAAEVGVASGDYSLEMLQWGMKTVLMVDPWEGTWAHLYQEAIEKVRQFGSRAIIRRTTSIDAAKAVDDGSLDFCYIDADHIYGIELDLVTWWAKVKPGGILSGHDYLNVDYDVNRAVTEFAAVRGLDVHLIIEHQDDASFWIEKP